MGVTVVFKRCLALLLCLALLPSAALADAAHGLKFRVTFEMDAQAYPDSVQNIMPGVADLLNVTTVEGLLSGLDGHFDLKADLMLGGQERTRTDLHLFGSEQLWHLRSSLLGDETLSFVMYTLLEFAMKGYTHLRIPLQRAAILVTPYVHKAPFEAFVNIAKPVLFAEEGSRTIGYDALLSMTEQIRDNAESNIRFRYWAQAVGAESGYDEYLMNLFRTFPEWIESFLPRDGLTVTADESGETWSTNALVLLRRETDLSGAQSVVLTLPPLPDGSLFSADGSLQPDGNLTHFSVNLLLNDGDGETLLDLRTNGSMPTALPVTRPFSLSWDADGLMVGGDGVHLRFEGDPTDQGVVIRQRTPDRASVMLTAWVELEATEVDFIAESVKDSTYAFAVDSNSLNDLMARIMGPMVRGLLPLIAQAPTSSCQTLMNLLEDSGVFGLLTDGFTPDDDWESEGDWEDDWDDDWDD